MAPALFNELTAAAAKGTKWSKYFSVEHCARQHEPKGVWLQCLACSELLGPSNPWRLVGDRRRRNPGEAAPATRVQV
jgi:hypothetical protein